jgi:hypothetical protein
LQRVLAPDEGRPLSNVSCLEGIEGLKSNPRVDERALSLPCLELTRELGRLSNATTRRRSSSQKSIDGLSLKGTSV